MTEAVVESTGLIQREHLPLFEHEPHLAAAVRSTEGRMLWCNPLYAAELNSTPAKLIGTLNTGPTSPHVIAHAREIFRKVISTARPIRFYQFWTGRRALVTVRAIDPASFGTAGCFVMARQDNVPASESRNMPELTFTAPYAMLGVFEQLSRRELEILFLIGMGLSNKQIAAELFRAAKTVANQISSIHQKLKMRSRSEVTRLAAERGITAFSREEWMLIAQNAHVRDTDSSSEPANS
jgi:DNA-binding CsgD family transcriptional regulator